jgi:hypothetical protein
MRDALAFYRKLGNLHEISEFQFCLEKVDQEADQVGWFLSSEIQYFKDCEEKNHELYIESRLEMKEANILLQRGQILQASLTAASHRILVNYLFTRYLFQAISDFETNLAVYVQNYQEFTRFVNKLTKKFFEVIERGFGNENIHKVCRKIVFKHLYCMLVDRIPLHFFLRESPGMGNCVQFIMDNLDRRRLEEMARGSSKWIRLLEKGVEGLIPMLGTDSFAKFCHFLLKTMNTIVDAVGSDDKSVIKGVVTWVVIHSSLEQLMGWHLFVHHFFRDVTMVDIVGGVETTNWPVLDDVLHAIAHVLGNHTK